MAILYQLTRPFAFAWINADRLNYFRLYIPFAIVAMAALVYVLLRAVDVSVDYTGLIGSIGQMVATLPGFYIAALAAVSSFQSHTLDREIEGNGAQINFLSQGKLAPVSLTYRVYLCFLFAYLTVVSALLAISIFLLQAITLPPSIADHWAVTPARVTCHLLLAFVQANLLVVTFHGLYFLAERMHRPSA